MNSCCFYGHIATDIEYKVTESGSATARFNIAVSRRSKERKTDFLRFVAFGKTAEVINNYFRKGSRIAVQAMAVQPDKFTDRNGNTRYPNVEFWISAVDFVDTKAESSQAAQSAPQASTNPKTESEDFMSVPEMVDEELPFS